MTDPPRPASAAIPARAIGDHRLSAAHLRVLAAVALGGAGRGTSITVAAIAETCGLPFATAGAALRELVTWHYVERQPDPMDRAASKCRVLYEAPAAPKPSRAQHGGRRQQPSQQRLTEELITRAKPGLHEIVLRDAEVPGFHLRISPGGTKTYSVWYRDSAGRGRRYKIARAGLLSITQARAEAQEVLDEVAAGRNPALQRDLSRALAELPQARDRARALRRIERAVLHGGIIPPRLVAEIVGALSVISGAGNPDEPVTRQVLRLRQQLAERLPGPEVTPAADRNRSTDGPAESRARPGRGPAEDGDSPNPALALELGRALDDLSQPKRREVGLRRVAEGLLHGSAIAPDLLRKIGSALGEVAETEAEDDLIAKLAKRLHRRVAERLDSAD